MNEFDFISKYFSPLSDKTHGLNLLDDAAILPESKGKIVITKDIMTEGTHFLSGSNPKLLAQKLVSVNVSDLASMGASPLGYLLGLSLPKNTEEKWFEQFSLGIKQSIKSYGGILLGGDTTSHRYGTTLSLTAIGSVCNSNPIKRNSAKPDDIIFVSGTIGDGFLGLIIENNSNNLEMKEFDKRYLLDRYNNPKARSSLGVELCGIASSMCDVSDGLIGDLEHILKASRVGAELYLEEVPISQSAKIFIDKKIYNIQDLVTGGDDYELLFTVPKNKLKNIENLKKKLDLKITKIGKITENKDFFPTLNGNNISLNSKGYKHF